PQPRLSRLSALVPYTTLFRSSSRRRGRLTSPCNGEVARRRSRRDGGAAWFRCRRAPPPLRGPPPHFMGRKSSAFSVPHGRTHVGQRRPDQEPGLDAVAREQSFRIGEQTEQPFDAQPPHPAGGGLLHPG